MYGSEMTISSELMIIFLPQIYNNANVNGRFLFYWCCLVLCWILLYRFAWDHCENSEYYILMCCCRRWWYLIEFSVKQRLNCFIKTTTTRWKRRKKTIKIAKYLKVNARKQVRKYSEILYVQTSRNSAAWTEFHLLFWSKMTFSENDSEIWISL